MTPAAPALYVLKALLVDFFGFDFPSPSPPPLTPQSGSATVGWCLVFFCHHHKSQRGQINSSLQEKSIKEQ